MNTNTYWNNAGKYVELAAKLQKLIPLSGAVLNPRTNKKLEKYRKATNCYYDLYNNGLGNGLSEFRTVIGFAASPFKQPWRGYGHFNQNLFIKTELAMDDIILAAAKEQNLF